MIDILELKQALQTIEQEKIDKEIIEQQLEQARSDKRKLDAIDYLKTLNLIPDNKKSLPEIKQKLYSNIDLLKSEMQKATYSELSQLLNQRIETEIIKINIVKDQQRALKVG